MTTRSVARLFVPILAAALFACALPIQQATPLQAGDAPSLFQSHFASVADGAPCYARSYPAEHLASHPGQRVAKIVLDMEKTDPDGKAITEQNLQLGFAIQLKTSPEWYANVAICKSAGAEIDCFLDGDGGRFTVTADGGAAIRIETGSYGIAMEGTKDFIELPADTGDDKLFVLPPAPRAECDAAAADVEEAK